MNALSFLIMLDPTVKLFVYLSGRYTKRLRIKIFTFNVSHVKHIFLAKWVDLMTTNHQYSRPLRIYFFDLGIEEWVRAKTKFEDGQRPNIEFK